MGGSSLGYKQAGCNVIGMVEWDKHACHIYRLNHPSTMIFQGDIEKISGYQMMEKLGIEPGELDILDGSPPCQGFSTNGKCNLYDPRNSLFKAFLRLIDEIQPKNIVIENVKGLISGKMKHIAAEIILSLKDRGYFVAAGLIKSSAFGVPQNRPRVFFLASKIKKPKFPRPTSKPIPAGMALTGIYNLSGIDTPIPQPCYRQFIKFGRIGEDQGVYHKRIGKKGGFKSCWILHPQKICRTIMKGPYGLYHWNRRNLNITEALVLTGFPIDYKMEGSYSNCWERIGNSVPPPLTKAIAIKLMELQYGFNQTTSEQQIH